MRSDGNIVFWSGDRFELSGDLALLRLGGHFTGGTVVHAPGFANGGVLLSGDIITVVQDRRWVSFMRSYPNLMPLPVDAVRRIIKRLGDARFDRLYGAWWDAVVAEGARERVERSAARYIAALEGTPPQ